MNRTTSLNVFGEGAACGMEITFRFVKAIVDLDS